MFWAESTAEVRSQPTVTHRKSSPECEQGEAWGDGHSHTQEEQSKECEEGEAWGDGHTHTQEEQSKECEQGETWGDGHSHTQEEQSRECEQGETKETAHSGHSGHKRSQWCGCGRVTWSERRGGQRGSGDLGHRKPWRVLGEPLEEGFSCWSGTRHKVLSRAKIQLVQGFKGSGCHSAENRSQKRTRDLWGTPQWPGEWPWPCAKPRTHYRDWIHSEGRAGHIMGFSEYPQIKTYRVWIPPTKATMSEYITVHIPWKKTTDSFTNNNNLSTSITAVTFSIINV